MFIPTRSWRAVGGDIVDDAVNTLDLVDDAHRDAVEHVIREYASSWQS